MVWKWSHYLIGINIVGYSEYYRSVWFGLVYGVCVCGVRQAQPTKVLLFNYSISSISLSSSVFGELVFSFFCRFCRCCCSFANVFRLVCNHSDCLLCVLSACMCERVFFVNDVGGMTDGLLVYCVKMWWQDDDMISSLTCNILMVCIAFHRCQRCLMNKIKFLQSVRLASFMCILCMFSDGMSIGFAIHCTQVWHKTILITMWKCFSDGQSQPYIGI